MFGRLLSPCLRIHSVWRDQTAQTIGQFIATRLGFLRFIASEWVEGVAELLFGTDAPEGLAQVTADLAIKWSRPNSWLLEHYRHLVRNAVSRDVEHALEHLLIAMLWGVPGYSVEDNISFLRQSPRRLSAAGETLGRLLRHGDAEDAHVACSVTFWDAAIAANGPEALPGFGWLAEVEKLADETWASRTMATLAAIGGVSTGPTKWPSARRPWRHPR